MAKIEVKKSLASTSAAFAIVLVMNFATGVCVARLMGPSGRGQVASMIAWVQTLGFATSFGLAEAYTYLIAKGDETRSDVVVTMFWATILTSTFAWILAFLALPHVFSSQYGENAAIAGSAAIAVPIIVTNQNLMAVTAGIGDFKTFSVARIGQPALTACLLLGCHFLFGLTVGRVLLCTYTAALFVTALCGFRLVSVLGVGRFSPMLLRNSFTYGLKQYGSNLGALVSAGLDIMLMPLVGLAASQIGIYSIAGNISMSVLIVMSSVSTVLFPAATGMSDEASANLIGKGIRLVLGAGLVIVCLAWLLAAPVIGVLYGQPFRGASAPLAVLLPGMILFSAAAVVCAGLQAKNLPQCAAMAQGAGFVVTVVGLALFLKPDGIMGASWVSLVAYSVTFLSAITLLQRKTSFQIADQLSLHAFRRDFASGIRVVQLRLGSRFARQGETQ